jgi:DNA polymerase-3 subunit delta'
MSKGDEPTWWSDAILDRSRWGGSVEPVLHRIASARDRDRFPHAVLLVGPRGLGRELAAVEAAVMLTCPGAEAPWSVSPCAERVRNGTHPDVVAMMPEGKKRIIKIDPLRERVVEVVGSRPYEGLRRVWIFDAVEREHLPGPSANAFLKTLEEPPEHAVFILLAANPTAVLPTIRSRCQQLNLPGAAAVAGSDGDGVPPELAAVALVKTNLADVLAEIRSALDSAAAGEPRHLLRLPHLIGDGFNAFELAASVATEMGAAADNGERGEALTRLAADLLATERRCRALNLGADRQLVSCLMRWFRQA